MNLGISVTKTEVRLSTRNVSEYAEATIRGYDATSYSKMTKSVFEKLKSELLKGIIELNPNNERISSIVVSFPFTFNFMELLDLKKLFQKIGLDVHRYIDNGMARGLVASLVAPKNFEGYICCVDHSDDCIELSLLCIDDGVVEAIQNIIYPVTVESNSKTTYKRLVAWKNDYNIQTVYCQATGKWLFDYDFVVASDVEIRPVMDEYVASRGALLQAEILSGDEKRLLPLEIFPYSILCVVNGEDEIELLQPDITIPTVRYAEVSTISPDWTEIEIISVNNSTGDKSSIFKTIFASLPEGRKVNANVNIGHISAYNTIALSIETIGAQIKIDY